MLGTFLMTLDLATHTVSLPKEDTACKKNIFDNYRAISINPVSSKMFEHCVLSRYSKYLETSLNQFGFKKESSCGHAIYLVRKVVEHYVSGSLMVNVCLLDCGKHSTK